MTSSCDVGAGASGPRPFERLAALWNKAPSGQVQGGTTTISAAVWDFEPDQVHDIVGDADAETHIISAPIEGRSSSTYFGDGRERYTRKLRPFDLNIVPAGERPRALLFSETRFSYIHLYLAAGLLSDLSEQCLPDAAAEASLIDPEGKSDPGMTGLLRSAAQEVRSGSLLSRMALDAIGQSAAIHLIRRHSTKAGMVGIDAQAHAGLRGDWRFRRAAEFLQARLGDDVGLAEVAAVVGLGIFHLTQLFKLNAGEPPHRWLMRQRFLRACELLDQGQLSVTEVAHACGFASSQHLATVFRKRLGVTPRQYKMTGAS